MSLVRNTLIVAALSAPLAAQALEYPIGEPKVVNGMEVAAVYLQPVEMAPAGMMRPAAESDVHLEADIHAVADNPNGFPEGFWIPDMCIRYEVSKHGSEQKVSGDAMAMVASDGPHYGDNVKLMGPGKYTLKFTIQPPGCNPHAHFGRHTDRETGVAEWWKPFTVEYEFTYVGVGKKGGY
ncbi:hypothetical protein G3580_00720 [Nitrogeniibacter mangrovi]|uniref:Iron transporter n=1 Tax=Nitrogeniibacter mangrovi TaxID=2016596 RepID=A0A6C1B238_9RHOO|nr:iron transporter [Nitrogeniibacter mangrovi]QID16274.1 hypothetical protein G3580_00720 [Nitrogeniibacter mangrovi]